MMQTFSVSCSLRIAASWNTEQGLLPYKRNAPRKLKKDIETSSKNLKLTPTPKSTPSLTSTDSSRWTAQSVSDLLKRNIPSKSPGDGDLYLGYDVWLPSPPKVEKPRSVYNAASLAYIGDCIYELYARRHFLFPPLSIEEYNDRVMAVVRCEAQDALLQKLRDCDFLSKREREVLQWGKNINSSKTRTKKRAGSAVYNRASSLETLIGHLYLTNVKRLEEIMQKLGFAVDSSAHLDLEKATSEPADSPVT